MKVAVVSDAGVSPGEKLLALVASGELTHASMVMVGEARIRIHGDSATMALRTDPLHRGQAA